MVGLNIEHVFAKFRHDSFFRDATELTSGHINDTYLVRTRNGPSYVLQRINHFVFKNVPDLMNNKVTVSKHLKLKYDRTKEYQALTFIGTHSGTYYHKDVEGNFWNLMLYIEASRTYEIVTKNSLATEAGALFGSFLNETADINTGDLVATIPNFHNMQFRLTEFDTALKNASKERKELSSKEIKTVLELKDEMLLLHRLTESGQLPTRVTHNDTKISNALFADNEKAICAIDLDTVMPGILHYDFGDAIRTTCANASEDEKDLSKVTLNLSSYEAFTKGFLTKLKHISRIESEYLAFSAKVMTFIMGLRMLTDFLNNDVYYKTMYDIHNLDRARNQFKLVAEIQLHLKEMQDIVDACLN